MNDISEFRFLFVGDNSHDARLVEDAIQAVFRAYPQSAFFSLRWVTDIPAAVAVLEEHPFQLIVYDMPSVDSQGLSAVEDIVAEATHIPVIVLVDEMEKYLHMDLLDRGAQSYLLRGELTTDRVHLTLCSVVAGMV